MKATKSFFIVVFILQFLLPVYAQDNIEEEITNKIINLFDLCKSREYEKSIPFLAIEEKVGNEYQIRALNKNNEDDLRYARRICNSVFALLKVSGTHKIIKTVKFTEGDTIHINTLIEFTSGNQKITKNFKLVIIKNIALLYDID